MNILVTGAIGSTLANHLRQAGHVVRGLVRIPQNAGRLSAAGIEPVLGYLDSADRLASEARRADAAINAAK